MPMTIGKVTNNVNVVDGRAPISEAMMEQIIRSVMARLKEEKHLEDQARTEREIPSRFSEPESR